MIPALLLVFAAEIAVGTNAIPGTVTYHWEVLYQDHTDWYETPTPRLDFTPRRGVRFRTRVRADGGPWSEPSAEIVADPFPGDANYDCVVGAPDLALFGMNFGRSCP